LYKRLAGVKQWGCGVNHPPPCSSEIKGNGRVLLLLPFDAFMAFVPVMKDYENEFIVHTLSLVHMTGQNLHIVLVLFSAT
jgi:hypothetical protein